MSPNDAEMKVLCLIASVGKTSTPASHVAETAVFFIGASVELQDDCRWRLRYEKDRTDCCEHDARMLWLLRAAGAGAVLCGCGESVELEVGRSGGMLGIGAVHSESESGLVDAMCSRRQDRRNGAMP